MNENENCINFIDYSCNIWKKTKLDSKGRIVLPLKLRKKLGITKNSTILWISCKHRNEKSNEFLIDIGVKK
jgi:bifunctional DNA-binding transcriptional regulator/antitoxin component of YhaV-PrlF toxin-antitoxin module